MKVFSLLLILFLVASCHENSQNYSKVVLENEVVNSEFLQTINEPERALLCWYLFAYGNECNENSSKIKCKLLKELNVANECELGHLNNLLQWFSTDMLAVYKLNSCPNIAKESPIQNTFEYIKLVRKLDTLAITYTVRGINSIQEKSWNMTKTGTYLIRNGTFFKLEINE